MRRFWDRLFGMDVHRSIWIEQDELGKERVVKRNRKRYRVKIPKEIDRKVTLRLSGIGRTKGGLTGNIYLHIWLNKGEDIRRDYWIPETVARNGVDRKLIVGDKRPSIYIPEGSRDGLVIRYTGLGRMPDFDWRKPFLRRKRGNFLLKLHVYPDTVLPRYGSFEDLPTRDMYLEGWVYRKYDQILEKIDLSSFPEEPIAVDRIARLFNQYGYRGVFRGLVGHLGLRHLSIDLQKSDSLTVPGYCRRWVTTWDNSRVSRSYTIQIQTQFVNNPFTTAAILAHELCHVVYSERIMDKSEWINGQQPSPVERLNEEQTVDLLVFMYKLGEFQIRVARDKRLTFGYFNQSVFDRMQVIVSRKMTADSQVHSTMV
jgi:hypothetical protein